MPQKARVPIAHHRFLLKPKEQAEMELPINPVNNTGRRPRRSENLPHNMAVQNWAKKKMDAADGHQDNTKKLNYPWSVYMHPNQASTQHIDSFSLPRQAMKPGDMVMRKHQQQQAPSPPPFPFLALPLIAY